MAAAEAEEKEVGIVDLEFKRLIFISEVYDFLSHMGEEDDGIRLQTTGSVSTQTTATSPDVSFIKSCLILEKLQVLPSTSEEVSVSILSQLLVITVPEAPSGNENDGS